jgi:hypothetical protein
MREHPHIDRFLANPTVNFMALSNGVHEVLQLLKENIVEPCELEEVILPSIIGNYQGSQFKSFIEETIQEANKVFDGYHLIQTIALDAEYVRNEDEMEALLEWLTSLDIDEFYIVAENPTGYRLEDPIWIGNLMTFCGGLKLSQKKVILGYGNHQYLPFACTGIDTLMSGTYLNVRHFTKEKFIKDDTQKNKSRWYYAPQTFSEYKIIYLETAYNAGIINKLASQPVNTYAQPLFSGTSPSLINWPEGHAHKHYLWELQKQCSQFSHANYNESFDFAEKYLKRAASNRTELERIGVRAETRSTEAVVDPLLSGLAKLNISRGSQLTRNWPR